MRRSARVDGTRSTADSRSTEEPELLSLPDSTAGAQKFRDRSTGLPLNLEMVKRAREHEMQYMDEVKVLERPGRAHGRNGSTIDPD